MTAPAVEIVAAADATNDAMVTATAEGLPSSARVQLVERPSPAADVIVQVQWSDAEHRRARLVVRTSDGRSAERTLSFDASDPASERGRALGFAVAAMIPEDLRTEEPHEEPAPAKPVSPPVNTPAPTPTAAPTPPSDARPDERRHDGDLRRALWIDATTQGALGIGGSASGLGGALAIRVPFEHLALRAGGAIRAGEVDEANASSTLVRADAGIAVFTVVVDPKLLVGARTGLVVLRHALSRTEEDGTRTSGAHTLVGLELMAEASFAIATRLAVIAAAGTEVAFGQTAVVVGEKQAATLPPVRAVFEAGARFAF